MNKKGIILQMLVGVFAIMFYVLSILLIFGSHINIDIGIQTSVEELKALPTFHRLITSEECLSTGRIGILNKSVLDEYATSGYEPKCASLPGLGYYVNVTDLNDQKNWVFGYEGQKKTLYGQSFVLIKYPSGEIHNGMIKFYKAEEDPVVSLIYGAEKAWLSSEPKTIIQGGKKEIKITKNEICYKDYDDPFHCKKFLNAKLEVDNSGFIFDPYEESYVKFKKTRDSEGNLVLELEKGSMGSGYVLNI